MELDWAQVKKMTLWQYDDLIEKLLNIFDYDFIQNNYNHTIAEAVNFSERVRRGYLQNGKETAFISEITTAFEQLETLGIETCLDLVQRVSTKEKCRRFVEETGFPFEGLIQLLNYLFRWVLPFKIPVKELVDTFDQLAPNDLKTLKRHKLSSNLDVLEQCRTALGRAAVANRTGLGTSFLLELTHRADISRLAYVRGKTIRHLCGGGYDTLDKIARADLNTMEADMTAYYQVLGKTFSDFKTVIPLDWMIGGAGILPRLVEV